MHRLQGLYGVTDSKLQPDDRILLETVEQALIGGMKVLQYRDKSTDTGKQLRQAGALKVLCHQHQAMLLINDDIELAINVEADGVHLGKQDGSLAYARERLGDYAIIGYTCSNSIERAKVAVELGADYIAFGRFFPSMTKPNAVHAELSIIPEAKELFNLPIIAIGGITVDNATRVIQAGADMVAVINNLFAAKNIKDRTREFQSLFSADSHE